jgi:hypothetical protein
VIRIYDDAGNVIETHEHKGDFKEWDTVNLHDDLNDLALKGIHSGAARAVGRSKGRRAVLQSRYRAG